jgi:heme A synthase
MSLLRRLSFAAAALAYALIVLGAWVRITGSGMGCGDDWPLCHGRLIPPLDDPATLIEWAHRLAAAIVSGLVLAVGAVALARRREPGVGGRGGALRPAALSVGLLMTQVLLGAAAVRLELLPGVVVLHLGVALALLATLQVTGLRAGSAPHLASGIVRPDGKTTLGATALGAAVILVGGLTANLGAGPACLGFPLCSGRLWPPATASGLSHVHWTHRLLAYALVLHLFALAIGFRARGAPRALLSAAWGALGIALAQVMVAIVMVLEFLTPVWRGLHAFLGTGLWVALVYLAWVSRSSSTRGVSGEW